MEKKRKWIRSRSRSRHHLTPRSRGGSSLDSNLLNMDLHRHQAWHLLFKNLTLHEIIELLQRLEKIKLKQRIKLRTH